MHHLESLIQTIPFNLFASSSLALSPTSPLDPSSPHASLASATHTYPLGVPPPSLSSFPLMNPSTFFPAATAHTNGNGIAALSSLQGSPNAARLAEETARMSLSPSYLYFDDEGYTRWQGETSGLPLLDLLVENLTSEIPISNDVKASPQTFSAKMDSISTNDWFPDRQPRRVSANPETLWRLITSTIIPELMDRSVDGILLALKTYLTTTFSLVQCFLSTSYYLMPFLHVPTFLEVTTEHTSTQFFLTTSLRTTEIPTNGASLVSHRSLSPYVAFRPGILTTFVFVPIQPTAFLRAYSGSTCF